jgi:Domain of unknown function (DUF5979)
LSKIITRLLPLLLFAHFFPASVGAQQPDRPPNVNLGDAVITGFSGTMAPDPTQLRQANKSVIDLTFVNPDGPSARIVGVGRPGYVWDGRLFQAPKTFDVFAKDVGQVFGVALDDQTPPNIYLAATSAFGLQIIGRGRDGRPERRKKGGPGSGWMKGQFGLDLQGGPGSIYKVDGTTGVVSLFANVTLNDVPNPGPGLGNVTYDPAHKQLFVSDLYTGMIHRFALDGRDLGSPHDHGVTGRPAARIAPVPFDPRTRLNIASPGFDSENPNTWGFAPPTRRVWGLAVNEGRLYYSARNGQPANGPQIWSVGIQPDGNFGADSRWELDVPGEPGSYPVSDIAFSQKGAMILAQRAPIAGSYDYSTFTMPGEPRVLRYWLKDRNDPLSPGRWKPAPEEYAVGFAGNYHNTNGGVALGYGYTQDGTLSATACEASLWTTGQNLRNNPAMRDQLEPGGPLVVHGLQGGPEDLVRDANAPPATSYFINYDDRFDDPRARGHLGSVRILARPCPAPVTASGGPSSVPLVSAAAPGGGPPGGPPPVCVSTCVCPPGTAQQDGTCVKSPAGCPPGTVLENGECVKVVFLGQQLCLPPMVPGPAPGSCRCPPGTVQQGRTCVTPQNVCAAPLVPGPCCPPGTVQESGECVPSPERASLEVLKKVENHAPVALPPGLAFQFTVSCGGASFPLTNGGSQTINNIPIGTSCTVTETLPTVNVCPRGTTPSWTTNFVPSATVIIHAGLNTVTAVNIFDCKKVGEVGTLEVLKKVQNLSPVALPPGLVFQFTVNCGGAPPFGLTDGGPPRIINNIPIGTSCLVTETPPTVNVCPRGTTPSWTTNFVPPVPVIIHAGLNTVTAVNIFDCKKVGEVGAIEVLKKVENRAPRSLPPGLTFQFTENCGSPPPFGLTNGGSHTINNIPVGSSCTVTETLATPPNVCPQGTIPVWSTSFVPSATVITHVGTTTVTAINTLDCKKAGDIGLHPECRAPLIANAAGTACACPDGTVQNGRECVRPRECRPPLVLNAAGTECVCRDGLVHRGQRCVPALECRPPLIANASGTECSCPTGTVRKGRECVRPIVCNAPAKPNRAGTMCVCPSNMVTRGNMCIERGRPSPRDVTTPRDGPRLPGITPRNGTGIPGITPRDGPRPNPGGGRDNPAGPRRGG